MMYSTQLGMSALWWESSFSMFVHVCMDERIDKKQHSKKESANMSKNKRLPVFGPLSPNQSLIIGT